MNSFDAAIAIGLIVAVITGFNAGLLRSGVTILAYLIAMPIAVWVMSMLYRGVGIELSLTQNSPFFFGIFLIIGLVLGNSCGWRSMTPLGPAPVSQIASAVPRLASCAWALSRSHWCWCSISWCRPIASRRS
jgi:hypothetical protein